MRWLRKRVSQTNSRCKRRGIPERIDADGICRNTGVILFAPEGPVYFECRWCREAILEPRRLSLDHILPLAKGGNNTNENCAITHRACNLLRGDMDGERWRTLVRVLQENDLWAEFKRRFKPRRFRR
jgi:5-methylcytosine-specific restriction endonuclease McrA